MITTKLTSLEEIKTKGNTLFNEIELVEDYKLNPDLVRDLNMVLKSNSIKNKIDLISKTELKRISYNELSEFQKDFNKCNFELAKIKEKIDIELFFKEKHSFNIEKLKVKFKSKKLINKFPNFNWDAYELYLTNPPLKLEMRKGETTHFDGFIVRKLITLMNQMIFNDQDIYGITTGAEGSGKSCLSSQISYYLYKMVIDIGLNDYKYDHKDIYWTDVAKMLDFQDDLEDEDFFRIYVLDEGDKLSRSNWNNKDTKDYKVQMRRDRRHLRINLINLPQFGELDTSIIESRANFIFYTDTKGDSETGLLEKGFCDMFIIPRSDFIYSELWGREITRKDILTYFRSILKDKSKYYQRPSSKYAVQTFRFQERWSFDMNAYSKNIIKQNRRRRDTNFFKVTHHLAYVMLKTMPPLSEWRNLCNTNEKPVEHRRYNTLTTFKRKIQNHFEKHPEDYDKFEKREELKPLKKNVESVK